MFASSGEVVAVQLGSSVVFGGICAAIAAGRGRSPIGWFLIGFFLNCIGLVLVLVLPDLKETDARLHRHELENRRLREQLAKERQVADQRHGHVERRLGVHDQALGLDTRAPSELPGAAPALPRGSSWFYASGRERLGPVSAQTIEQMLKNGTINLQTLVWCEGMPDWQRLGATPEFGGDRA
ncbi:MAG TPA: DUF4339 domain-containing protein [Planctomycetota bacterium]|nr:DUF4339 domain-containing protein [Planctomycetota bacterium]